WKAKDVDEDGKFLKIRSRCVKVFGYILQELKKINLKKHEVKQVQQSSLREDCWELYIPDLVPWRKSVRKILRLAEKGVVSAASEVVESARLSIELRRELQGRHLVKLLTADPINGGGSSLTPSPNAFLPVVLLSQPKTFGLVVDVVKMFILSLDASALKFPLRME
ncbi:hypothetical protein Tco_1460714, partial [Tanacetum coccineum]